MARPETTARTAATTSSPRRRRVLGFGSSGTSRFDPSADSTEVDAMRMVLPQGLQRRLDPAQRYGLRLTLVAVAVVLVALPFAALTFQVVGGGPVTRLDARLANDLNAWVEGRTVLLPFLRGITWLGRPVVLAVVVAAAAAYTWSRHLPRLAIFLVATSMGGGLVNLALKVLVDRPRPVVDHPVLTAFGKSFPSGHSLGSTVVFGALLVVFLPVVSRKVRSVTVGAVVLLVLAIGSSRMLLGVHFMSDVAGGYALGLAWLAAATAVFEVWRVERGTRPSNPLTEGIEPEAEESLS